MHGQQNIKKKKKNLTAVVDKPPELSLWYVLYRQIMNIAIFYNYGV